MISNLITSICASCLMLLIVPGCHFRSISDPGSNDPKPPVPAQSKESSDLLNSGVFDSNPQALKAWLKFIEDGRYRVADAKDFKFSEAAKGHLRNMFGDEWYPRINHPAITGNISRRHGFKDFAAMVIDSRKNDPARFGVVIFNVEPDKDDLSVHWLFRDRDLSSAILDWFQNWPVLVFYQEDGSSDPYYLNWNENKKIYFLDKQQMGPDARAGRLREKGGS